MQPLPLRISPRTCGKITLAQQIPEANPSLNTSELPRCACAASPKGRARVVVRLHLRGAAGGILGGGDWRTREVGRKRAWSGAGPN